MPDWYWRDAAIIIAGMPRILPILKQLRLLHNISGRRHGFSLLWALTGLGEDVNEVSCRRPDDYLVVIRDRRYPLPSEERRLPRALEADDVDDDYDRLWAGQAMLGRDQSFHRQGPDCAGYGQFNIWLFTPFFRW